MVPTTSTAPEPSTAPPSPSPSASAPPATAPQAPPAAPTPAAPAATAPPAQSGAQTSVRGNLVKQIGETAGIRDENGEYLVTFVVNSISTNVACTGSSPEPSENGVFAVIDVSVQTSPNMLESELIEYFNMDADAFTAIGPDGVTSNASPFSAATFFCLDDSELLPSSIGPGENARGKVLLDLEDPSGILIYEDFWTDSAWEWTYPG